MRIQTPRGALRRALRLAAAALPLALSGCLEAAAPDFSHIFLYTHTPQGEPVSGVRVEMIGGWAYKDIRAVGTTNSAGQLRLTVPGDYFEVRMHAPGPEWKPALIIQQIHLDDGENWPMDEVFARTSP